MKIIHEYTNATEAVDKILKQAVQLEASDIHIDPRPEHIYLRFRIDGNMEDGGLVAKHIHKELIAKLKILSGARTDIHAIPQDGRWCTDISGFSYNIRISFMPTYNGENAVLRLLPAQRREHISFAQLDLFLIMSS